MLSLQTLKTNLAATESSLKRDNLDEVTKSLEKKNGEYGEIVFGKILNMELVLSQFKNNLETLTNQLQTKEDNISWLKQQFAQSQSSWGDQEKSAGGVEHLGPGGWVPGSADKSP